MSAALASAGLLMGLAGSPHCAVMCGAPCAAVARRCGGDSPAQASWAWHLGRIAAYAVVGGLCAASVGFLSAWSGASATLRPLWTMLQVAVLFTGLAVLWTGRMPRWIDAAAQRVTQGGHLGEAVRIEGPRPLRQAEGLRRAALIGLAWVALPCGLLWSALAIAALADGPLQGAFVMGSFGLGSAIGLLGAPWALRLLERQPRALALRVAGALLVGASVVALLHGLEAVLPAWCRIA